MRYCVVTYVGKGSEKEGPCVYVQLIYLVIHLKLTSFVSQLDSSKIYLKNSKGLDCTREAEESLGKPRSPLLKWRPLELRRSQPLITPPLLARMRSWCLQVTFSVTSPSQSGRLPAQPLPGP